MYIIQDKRFYVCLVVACAAVFAAIILIPNWNRLERGHGASPRVLTIGPDFTRKSLAGHLVLVEGVAPHEGIEDIVSGRGTHREIALSGNLALGYRTDETWLKVEMERADFRRRNLFLWMQPSVLDHVRVYLVERHGLDAPRITEIGQIGDNDPDYLWNGVGSYLILEYKEPVSQYYDLYFNIGSTSSILLSGHIGTVEQFNNRMYASDLTVGFYISFLMTVSFIFVVLFFRSFSKNALYFALFSFMYAVNIMIPARMYELLPVAVDMNVMDIVNVQSLILLHIAGALFFRQYFELWITNEGLNSLSLWLCAMLLAMAIGAGLGGWQAIMPIELGVVAIALWLYFFEYVRQFLSGRKLSRAGLLGTGLYSVEVSTYHLILIGAVAPDGPSLSIIYLANALFILLFTLGLIEEAAVQERRNRLSLNLRLARRAEQTAVRLAREMTRELEEAKVAAEKALETERRAQAEQLRFVDVISHQLLTPVAVIKSSVASLRRSVGEAGGDDAMRLQRIETAVRRLRETIDVSLVRSRISSVGGRARKRKVVLVTELQKIVERSCRLFPSRDVTLEFDNLDLSARANIDVEMLGIAIGNLIDNALKFSDREEPVAVTVSRDGDELSIAVRDRGIGVPVDEIPKVKERYYRGSNAASYFGTGLGLDIVNQVALAHGGRLEVENAPVGGLVARLAIVGEFDPG
ncbi:sensor histidine kinase [Hoeflea olei]|uniref:histidine kinase n=1 Tax=Hoeflea olei TaxID=1480615 RepID=A0A1C1YV96_9HYPH|nr:sensor histidine kinase [Hoeflea olei]OCW57431.1 hypothetical protein AWJ14_00860 [Hoeflea olei]